MQRQQNHATADSRGLVWVVLAASVTLVVLAAILANTGNSQTPQAMVAAGLNGRTPGVARQPGTGLRAAAAAMVYYEPTIRDIINADCSRCHSGAARNLMDYDNLNAYAQSGMLSAMVQGPMRNFAGADADAILAWVDAGAPEKAPARTATAAALTTPRYACPPPADLGVWKPLP